LVCFVLRFFIICIVCLALDTPTSSLSRVMSFMKKRLCYHMKLSYSFNLFLFVRVELFFGGTRGIILEPAALSFPLDESCILLPQLPSSLLTPAFSIGLVVSSDPRLSMSGGVESACWMRRWKRCLTCAGHTGYERSFACLRSLCLFRPIGLHLRTHCGESDG